MKEETWTIQEIRELLKKGKVQEEWLTKWKADHRKGVQQLIRKYERELVKQRVLEEKFAEMLVYENQYRAQGYEWIAGCDEVGRGPLAGPVVAAAVILPTNFYLPGLNDSKKLTVKKREEFASYIKQHALSYRVQFIEVEVIDQINILEASKKAMYDCLTELPRLDIALVDAVHIPNLKVPQKSIIKGDEKSVSIAAASVLAKVERDNWMKELSEQYPEYQFDKNNGYGTGEHIAAIRKYGITKHHRKTFLKSI